MTSKAVQFLFHIVLLAAPFMLPAFQLHDETGTLLTAVSLLFAILVGFFIATTTSNYLRLQTLLADSNANLISIYNLVGHIEPNKKHDIGEAIDQYMIASLDYQFLDYTDKTKKELDQIIKVTDVVEPINEKGYNLFSELHSKLGSFFSNEQEIALTTKTIVTPRHWLILILLSILLGASLLSFRGNSMLISAFISVMFITIYQVLLLIHEIDTNSFLSDRLSYEDPQQVFHSIGRHYYYPEYALKKGFTKPKSDIYRMGIYKNYPQSLEKEIKLIQPK